MAAPMLRMATIMRLTTGPILIIRVITAIPSLAAMASRSTDPGFTVSMAAAAAVFIVAISVMTMTAIADSAAAGIFAPAAMMGTMTAAIMGAAFMAAARIMA